MIQSQIKSKNSIFLESHILQIRELVMHNSQRDLRKSFNPAKPSEPSTFESHIALASSAGAAGLNPHGVFTPLSENTSALC